jgi:hypothetical protein
MTCRGATAEGRGLVAKLQERDPAPASGLFPRGFEGMRALEKVPFGTQSTHAWYFESARALGMPSARGYKDVYLLKRETIYHDHRRKDKAVQRWLEAFGGDKQYY